MKAKRLLALALALITALAVIPFTATAVAVNPISSAEQLVTLMNTPEKWDGAYYLTKDIDLTDIEGQSPIGMLDAPFTGYFDGMGYSIEGLDISGEMHLGLFGCLDGATVKNLSVSGTVVASTTTNRGVGGLAGVVHGDTVIDNVNSDVNVTSGFQGVAGLVGHVYTDENDCVEIRNCTTTGTVTALRGAANLVGLITLGGAAETDAVIENGKVTISNCYSSGDVIYSSDNGYSQCGGMIGNIFVYNASGFAVDIEDCVNASTVTHSNKTGARVGGVVGWLDASSSKAATTDTGSVNIRRCVNTADIVGSQSVGGIVGYVTMNTSTEFAVSIIECVNNGNISTNHGTTTSSMYAGGIAGDLLGGDIAISNCANCGTIKATKALGGIIGRNQKANAAKELVVKINSSLNCGTVQAVGTATSCGYYSGAIVGLNYVATANNCYYIAGSAVDGKSVVQKAVGFKTLGSSAASELVGCSDVNSANINTAEIVASLNGTPSSGAWKVGTNYPELTKVKIKVTEITNISLTVGTDLSFNAFATLAEGVDAADTKVVFTYADEDPVEVTAEAAGGLYRYTLKALPPQAMTELITVELYVGDELVDKTQQTVRGYCEQLIDNDGNSDELVQLAKDILAYGAAAQEYRDYNLDSLANEGVEGATEFAQLGADKYIANLENGETVNGVKFTGIGVRFDYVNSVFFKLTAPSVDGITVIVNGEECAIEEYGDSYIVYSAPINATEFDDEVVAVLKYGDTVVQTVTYSVASFVYEMQNAENSAAADLAKALYNYGLSAVAYAAN